MKKITALLLALLMLVGALAGCGKQNDTNKTDKLSIVTTIFPEYDWVREILGDKADNAEVTMLLDNGVDLHSYQPTADDIVKISDCDLFIYVGGESDGWVDDALKNATNKNMKVINLLDVLGAQVKEEETAEEWKPRKDAKAAAEMYALIDRSTARTVLRYHDRTYFLPSAMPRIFC
ncbi:MAG: metal ABC transporter substrate-binding protein [Butyricicoccus sp.]